MYKPRIIQGQDHPTYLEKWKLKLVQCHAQLEQEIGNLYEGIFGQMFKQLSPVAVAVSDPKSEPRHTPGEQVRQQVQAESILSPPGLPRSKRE